MIPAKLEAKLYTRDQSLFKGGELLGTSHSYGEVFDWLMAKGKVVGVAPAVDKGEILGYMSFVLHVSEEDIHKNTYFQEKSWTDAADKAIEKALER